MLVLIGCEESATVRDAFRAAGHDAWSCDLVPTRGDPQWHYERDVLEVIGLRPWDLGIFHPPCTYLAKSGERWLHSPLPQFAKRWEQMREAATFFNALLNCGIPRVACENPRMHGHGLALIGKPTFYLDPFEHGERQKKRTCFWSRNLPPLLPTAMVGPPPNPGTVEAMSWEAVWREPPGPFRARNRSKTFPGVGQAMVQQWGNLPLLERTHAYE